MRGAETPPAGSGLVAGSSSEQAAQTGAARKIGRLTNRMQELRSWPSISTVQIGCSESNPPLAATCDHALYPPGVLTTGVVHVERRTGAHLPHTPTFRRLARTLFFRCRSTPAPHTCLLPCQHPVPGSFAHRVPPALPRHFRRALPPLALPCPRLRGAPCRSSAPPRRSRPCLGRRRPAGRARHLRAWRACGSTTPTSLTTMTTQGRCGWGDCGLGGGRALPWGGCGRWLLFFFLLLFCVELGGRTPASGAGDCLPRRLGGGRRGLARRGCWPAPAAFWRGAGGDAWVSALARTLLSALSASSACVCVRF